MGIETSNYLWQNIANQGYNKYGKGVVGPGSKEALDGAVNLHAGSPDNVTKIEVLTKPTHISNRWGDFGTDYKMNKGELRMTYGPTNIDYMHPRWKKLADKLGVTKLIDQAGSCDINLMETTHRSVDTGEYLIGQLRKPGTVINAYKDATNIGVKIPTMDMTHILSSEALKAGASPTELKPGMVIASDALGVYSPNLKQLLKKNVPVDDAGKAVVDKLKKFDHIQDLATKYAKEGFITEKSAAKYIDMAWDFVKKWGSKL